MASLPPYSISQDKHKDTLNFKGRGPRLWPLTGMWQVAGGACGTGNTITYSLGKYNLPQKTTLIFGYCGLRVFYYVSAKCLFTGAWKVKSMTPISQLFSTAL